MQYIRHAKLVLEDGILWDGVLGTEGDRIALFGREGEIPIPPGAETLDAGGAYLGPGFVDIHVHGGDGHLFAREPEAAIRHFLRHGETTVLATFYYTMDKAEFLDGISRVQKVMRMDAAGQALAGFYMEGPYMNPKYGANRQRNKWNSGIRAEDYRPLVDLAGEDARVWAVAPELEGLEPFLRYVRSVNPRAVFAVGHSEATPAQIGRLKRYGLRLQTHCMDATGRVESRRGTRSCGPDEACLADPDFYTEVICDSLGIHVQPEMLRLILRVKGVDRVLLITDSYVGDDADAPAELRGAGDLLFDANGDLSGSKLTMDVACRNLMAHTNCGIAQAFLLASRNPARVLGMDDEIGTIGVGKRADLVLVDDMFHVKGVMLRGKLWKEDEECPKTREA